jgi:hypothetical protein
MRRPTHSLITVGAVVAVTLGLTGAATAVITADQPATCTPPTSVDQGTSVEVSVVCTVPKVTETATETATVTVPGPTTTATVTATATATVTATPTPTAVAPTTSSPTPTTPTATATTTPPPSSGLLPYTADSFFKSRVDGATVPIDSTLTSQMHAFMATAPDQKGVTWPKINLNPGWSGHNYVHRAGDTAPVWKLSSNTGGTADSRLNIVRSQGVHIADKVWSSVPTGTQDRLLVLQDHVYGYTVQCADVVPNTATRTWTASNCGILWHSSNGLDYRNPRSNDQRNFTSRGRIIDAMQIPRAELDRAIANGTGVGHVLHLFWVETNTAHGFVHPMINDESDKAGWGIEGVRLRLKPSVDLVARGLTGAGLAIARTYKEHGTYIGDNSGSPTQTKVGPPEDYVGTNLATDYFKGKLTWNDFEVVQPGWQQ